MSNEKVISKNISLTIGIPAYNRPESFKKIIEQLSLLSVQGIGISILIIDDCSDKSKYEDMLSVSKSLISEHKIIHLRNNSNLGYARNFIRLFEESNSDYLMPIADDDIIFEEGFNSAINFLLENQVDLLSPMWIREDKIHRGRNSRGAIFLQDFMECSHHAPGIFYNVNTCKKYLAQLKDLLNENCAMTHIYPQVILSMKMLADSHKGYWFDAPIGKHGESLPSGIRDPGGNKYMSYKSFLLQASALDNLLHELDPTLDREVAIERIRSKYATWIYESQNIEHSLKEIFLMALSALKRSIKFWK